MSVYFIVGAAGGIGQSLCEILSEKGAHLILAGRNQEPLKALQLQVGGEVCLVDACDGDALKDAMESVAKTHGKIDVAVNLAGSILLKPAHRTSGEEWESVIAQNLTTAFNLVRAAATVMRKSGGSIVLCASGAAKVGLANHEAIAAAKAGVIGLTLSAAATYAPCGIRVNAVAPGLTDTPLATSLFNNEAAKMASLKMHPLGRLGCPEDIARAIAFLVASENSWITGQVLAVDGGLSTLKVG